MSKNSEKNPNRFARWFGSNFVAYSTIAVATIILLIAGIFLYKKLEYTKSELKSCRSSCSGE